MDYVGAFEDVEIALPVNGAYVSTARLTASSIANRMRFDVNEVEEIKSAVSEACTLLIKKSPTQKEKFRIVFQKQSDKLSIYFKAPFAIESVDEENDMSLIMIRGLMDNLRLAPGEECFELWMEKNHRQFDLGVH